MFQDFQSDTDLEEDFSFIQPVDLITKDVYQLRQMIKEKRRILQKDKDKDKEIDKEHEEERGRVREKERHEREKEQEKDRERTEKDKQQEKQHEEHNERDMVTDQEDRINATHEGNGVSGVKHEGSMHFLLNRIKYKIFKFIRLVRLPGITAAIILNCFC